MLHVEFYGDAAAATIVALGRRDGAGEVPRGAPEGAVIISRST